MYIPGIAAQGLLSQSTVVAVSSQFLNAVGHAIDPEQVVFHVDAINSRLDIESREYTSDGEAGQFLGSVSVNYTKVDIDTVLPYPIFVNLNYPTNFALLRNTMFNDYGIVLEEYDLSKSPGGGPMDDSIPLNGPIDTNHQLTLYTTTTSGRFKANQPVRFVFATYLLGRSLSRTLRQNSTPSVESVLTNPATIGWKTAMGASIDDIGYELLKRHYGESFDASSVELRFRSLDWHTVVMQINGTETNPVWRGYTEFFYEKASIEKYVVDALTANITYPVPFKVLRRYLNATFGFDLAPGEFALQSPFNTPVAEDDLIDAPLDESNTLVFYVTRDNLRWIGREKIKIQFVKSISDYNEDLFGGAAPTQYLSQAYNFAYQPTNLLPVQPITYAVVSGTPPVTLDSNGHYSGYPSSVGFYTWTVAAYGFGGSVALQTEFVEIQPDP